MLRKVSVALLCSLLLHGCGGGGGDSKEMSDDTSPKLPAEMEADYAYYSAQLQKLHTAYQSRPTALNTEATWYKSLSYPSSAIKKLPTNAFQLEEPMYSGVGNGSYMNTEDGRTFIFDTFWQNSFPNSGGVHILVKEKGKADNLYSQSIPGAARVHVLKNADGSKSVVIPGHDEGELAVGEEATAPSYQLNQETMVWEPVGVELAAHGSIVFDYENDGDEDVLASSWAGTYGRNSVIFENNNGVITPLEVNTSAVPGKSFIAPFYADDGELGLVFTDAYSINQQWNSFPNKGNILAFYNTVEKKLESSKALMLPLPYFEREAFKGVSQVVSWEENIGLSHDTSAKVIDLDYDGDLDIVIGSKIWSDDYPYGVIQLLVNDNGTYIDETDSRLFNWVLAGNSTHQLDFIDINQDGFVDIFVSTNGDTFSNLIPQRSDELKQFSGTGLGGGSRILINDGTGHFVVVAHHLIWKDYVYGPTFIPSIDSNGKIRFTRFETKCCPRPSTTLEIEEVEFEYRYSTGPNGRDPAEWGEPGFNEFYYLLHNASARKAVENGEFETGLEHYLSVGKNEGLKINAK